MNATEKKYVEKLKELVLFLDDCNFSTTVDKDQWLKRKRLYNELAALESQSEVSYPREFVEWINWEDDRDDFHFIKDYTMNLWLNVDEDMLGYNTDELFDYWQSKVEPK